MAGKTGGIRAGLAYVEMFLKDNALTKGLNAAEKRLKAFGTSVAAVGAGLTGFGTALATPFLGAAKMFADVGSELADMSARTGLSVESLSALGHAATQTGTDLAAVETGVRKMQKTLVAAAQGSDQAQQAFGALGLSVGALMQMSPDEQFNAVAKAIGRVKDPTAKAAAAMSILGKSGTALIPMIDDIEALTDEAKRLGLVMSTEDAAAADTFGDAMDIVSKMVKRTAVAVGAALAPELTALAGTLTRVAKSTLDWVAANKPLIVTAFKVAVGIAAAGAALTALGVTIVGVGTVLGTIATAISAVGAVIGTMLLTPLGLITTALVTAGVVFLKFTDKGKASLASLGEAFKGFRQTVNLAFGGIADALSAGEFALAGKIAMAALTVEWQKGAAAIKGIWSDMTGSLVAKFQKLKTDVAGIMVDLGADMQTAWAITVSDLGAKFDGFVAKMLDGIDTVRKALAGMSPKDLMNPFTALTQVGGRVGGAAIGKFNEGKAPVDDLAEGRAKALEDQLAKIERDRAMARKALGDPLGAGAQPQGAPDAAADAARADLFNAMEELAKLRDVAATKANEAAAAAGAGGKKKAVVSEDDIEAGVAQAARKVDVSGTFSAAAIAGLGAGSSVADDQLNEQKKANQKLDKLNDQIRQKRAVFAD